MFRLVIKNKENATALDEFSVKNDPCDEIKEIVYGSPKPTLCDIVEIVDKIDGDDDVFYDTLFPFYDDENDINVSGETEDVVEIEKKYTNDNIIKNISFDQSEILHNIMELYNNGEGFDCDMTASELKFYQKGKGYKYLIPEPKILFDVFPKFEKIKKIEPLGRLPLEDNSINSIVIDLPFVVSPPQAPSANKDGASLIFKRFYGFYPVDDLYETYFHWISEAFRVLKENGTCVFKCQSTVSGGVQHNTEEWSYMSAQKVGFTIEDKFYLEAKARLISNSKMKKQAHARKYTSVFYVFKKTLKKKSKNFNYFDLIEKYSEIEATRNK